MRIAKIAGGVVLAFVGIVWMLQGFGATYVPTSFMTKQRAVSHQPSARRSICA